MPAFSVLAMLAVPLLWVAQVGATTLSFPATVEVDLIFPHNETYAPSPVFPVVFAFQNAALAASLDPNLGLGLWDTSSHNITSDSSGIDLMWDNLTESDPLYVWAYFTSLGTTHGFAETTHNLIWSFFERNCSDKNELGAESGASRTRGVSFTIRDGAQQPDLVAATRTGSNTLCANSTYLAFNLTGTMDISPSEYDHRNTCAVFSDVQPLVSGNPCAVQMPSATASSIMAAITATECARISPAVSCPPSNGASSPGWNTGHTVLQGNVMAGLVAAAVVATHYL